MAKKSTKKSSKKLVTGKKRVMKRPTSKKVVKRISVRDYKLPDIKRITVGPGLDTESLHREIVMAPILITKNPSPPFPTWENNKCGICNHEDSNALYKLICPECSKEGCGECMPAGRGCLCPECQEKPHNKYSEDPPEQEVP